MQNIQDMAHEPRRAGRVKGGDGVMPNVIHLASYLSDYNALAWQSAGWGARITDAGAVEAYGPVSVLRTIALDILDMTGCLDARIAD